MNWPRRIYVATRNRGVYYTENFTTPEKQPIWYQINEGLPSLDVIEFHVDLRPPEERDNKDILYALLSNKATIYRKIGSDPWHLFQAGYCIHGFDAVPSGGITVVTGARGVVDPVDPNYHGPGDPGDTMIPLGCDAHPCCQGYCHDGSPTIWTYGCGTTRGGYYTFALGMGAPGYISKLAPCVDECVYCPALHIMCGIGGESHKHVYFVCTGTGNWTAPLIYSPYGNRLYTVLHPNLSGFQFVEFNGTGFTELDIAPLNGFGSDTGYDSMWVNPEDPDHMRIVSGSYVHETFDAWATKTSGSTVGMTSLATYAGEDPDNILGGGSGGGNIIGVFDGMNDTWFKPIGGAMRNTPPYTGSIPSVATGGIATGGIAPIPNEPGGLRVYAVGMPYYRGDQRGMPMDGDRSAWNVTQYPDKHAKDLNDGALIRHAPLPTGVGDIIYSTSGSTWDTYRLPSLAGFGYKETIFTFNGELSKKVGPFRIYNKLGVNQLVHKVALSVAGAPLGNQVIVDVRRLFSSFDTEGTSVWAPNNGSPGWEDVRPRISSGSYYGETSDTLSPRGVSSSFIWGNGKALRAEIAQVGSSYGGAYLVVHLVHGDTSEEEPSFTASTGKPAYLAAPPGITKRAWIAGGGVEDTGKVAYILGGLKTGKAAYVEGDT